MKTRSFLNHLHVTIRRRAALTLFCALAALAPGARGDTIISCSTNITGVECTGGLTPVSYTVTATNTNGPVPVTCVPPSGTGFRVGTSNVVCAASGTTVSCAFTVTVVDTTPPTVTCNADIFVQATNAAGRAVNYTAGAFDACGIGSFNCLPLPGTIFPIGVTTVTCKATDSVGNSNSCSFIVTVLDCPLTFRATLSGAQEVSPANSPGTGSGTVVLSADETTITVNENWSGLLAPATASHIHAPAGPGTNAAVLFPFAGVPAATAGAIPTQSFAITPVQVAQLKAGLFYMNVHSAVFPGGEIRGQLILDTNCETIINCSSNITVECTGGLTPVTFNVTASNASGPVPVTCVPPSGTRFRLGTSNVVCTAGGTTSLCSFTVTVVDTTPPTVTCNSNRVVDATSPAGANVAYSAGAFDACGILSLVCLPPGSQFPIGVTTVSCVGVDNVGNSNSCSFTVTVQDSTPPSIICPTEVTVDATSPSGSSASYPAATAADATGNHLDVVCTPAPGSTFPIGTNIVSCTTTNQAGSSASCSFDVIVQGPRAIKLDVLGRLNAWRPQVTDKDERKKLDAIINDLGDSLPATYWVDDSHVTLKYGDKAIKKEESAAKDLVDLVKYNTKNSKRTRIPPSVLQDYINRIVQADRLLALVAIADAQARGGKARLVTHAIGEVTKGDGEVAEVKYDAGIEDYRHAWDDAIAALP